MRKDAETHTEEDRRRKELIEVRNNADNTAYSAEKLLKDLAEKVPADIKSKVEDGIAKVRETLKGEVIEAIRSANESLSELIQQVGAAAYQQAGPAADSPDAGSETDSSSDQEPPTPPEGDDEDVVDGEFHNA